MEKNLKKYIYIYIYIYIYTHTHTYLQHFAVHLKHCKSTTLQFKKRKKNPEMGTGNWGRAERSQWLLLQEDLRQWEGCFWHSAASHHREGNKWFRLVGLEVEKPRYNDTEWLFRENNSQREELASGRKKEGITQNETPAFLLEGSLQRGRSQQPQEVVAQHCKGWRLWFPCLERPSHPPTRVSPYCLWALWKWQKPKQNRVLRVLALTCNLHASSLAWLVLFALIV